MKAFLSYKFQDDVSSIINLLKDKEIEIFDSMTDIKYRDSFQKAIKQSISECDFLLLIYSSINPNIAFEAGIAVSMNKPIFAIINNNHCDFLFDSTYVYALPNEIDKIKFNFEIFLNKIKSFPKSNTIKKHVFYGGGLPNYYNEIINSYINTQVKNEKEYKLFFKNILEKSNLDFVQQTVDPKSDIHADFCIWSNDLSNVLGNPILIEIKKEINTNNIKYIKDFVNKLISDNLAKSCLFFYEDLKGMSKKQLPNNNTSLFIQISDLIDKLNKNDFNESIRKIRNEIVHNQY